MPVIHLIRHGETDGNRTHYIGRRDLALNATGRAQAFALATTLSAFPIGRILSSPLQRAMQTAHPLALQLGLPVEQEAALIEIDFGHLQDQPKADTTLNLRKTHAVQPLDGGESLFQVWTRLLPFAAHLHALPATAELAIIGHYWSNRMLHGLLCRQSFDQTLQSRDYRPENAASIRLRLTGSPAIIPS